MNNHYVNQINNKETSLLNINKTMFNDPSGNNAYNRERTNMVEHEFFKL